MDEEKTETTTRRKYWKHLYFNKVGSFIVDGTEPGQ
jgi:hypothetical protein